MGSEERGDADDEKATMGEKAKEGSSFLENMQAGSMEEIERPSFGGEAREIDVSDESSSDMNTVVEFNISSVKSKCQKQISAVFVCRSLSLGGFGHHGI